jgi:hypothetical protein
VCSSAVVIAVSQCDNGYLPLGVMSYHKLCKKHESCTVVWEKMTCERLKLFSGEAPGIFTFRLLKYFPSYKCMKWTLETQTMETSCICRFSVGGSTHIF